MRHLLFLIVATIAVLAVPGYSQTEKPWQQLFNGKDLTGWKHVGPLIFGSLPGKELEVMPKLAQHRFRLASDLLQLRSGEGWNSHDAPVYSGLLRIAPDCSGLGTLNPE